MEILKLSIVENIYSLNNTVIYQYLLGKYEKTSYFYLDNESNVIELLNNSYEKIFTPLLYSLDNLPTPYEYFFLNKRRDFIDINPVIIDSEDNISVKLDDNFDMELQRCY